jgi:phosphopantothenoylcysteine decarboxylase
VLHNQSSLHRPAPCAQLRRWADVLLIAPLSANSLAKLAGGLCDNLLTCVARAWDFAGGKPLVVAPAMNTAMWEHPLTTRQLGVLTGTLGVRVVPPVSKALACGDVGAGAMASVADIVAAVRAALAERVDVGGGSRSGGGAASGVEQH